MGSAAATITQTTVPAPSGRGCPEGAARATIDLRGGLARLLAGGEPPDGVRAPISASWRRSLSSGLRPDRLEVPFDAGIDSDGPLVRAGRPVLGQLANDLAGAGVGVVLTDAGGHIVDRRGSEGWLSDRLDQVRLAPGYVYAEDAVGTNGIGTALATRGPVTVEGDEHFADALTGVACAAAPITDLASGVIVGVIDLTCMALRASPLMLPLVLRAARDIEQRLAEGAGLPERLALQWFLRERRGAKGPFVLLTARRMFTNAAADRLVAPGDEPLLRQGARRLRTAEDGRGVTLVLGRGAMVSLHSEPVPDGGSPTGTIIRLTPVARTDGTGHHRRHAATIGWESLTDTERSVAELVAEGLTNREAGERLFLSRHTVGFHLRSIFRKLGTSSRVELARLAVEEGHGQFLTGSRSSVDAVVPRFAS